MQATAGMGAAGESELSVKAAFGLPAAGWVVFGRRGSASSRDGLPEFGNTLIGSLRPAAATGASAAVRGAKGTETAAKADDGETGVAGNGAPEKLSRKKALAKNGLEDGARDEGQGGTPVAGLATPNPNFTSSYPAVPSTTTSGNPALTSPAASAPSPGAASQAASDPDGGARAGSSGRVKERAGLASGTEAAALDATDSEGAGAEVAGLAAGVGGARGDLSGKMPPDLELAKASAPDQTMAAVPAAREAQRYPGGIRWAADPAASLPQASGKSEGPSGESPVALETPTETVGFPVAGGSGAVAVGLPGSPLGGQKPGGSGGAADRPGIQPIAERLAAASGSATTMASPDSVPATFAYPTDGAGRLSLALPPAAASFLASAHSAQDSAQDSAKAPTITARSGTLPNVDGLAVGIWAGLGRMISELPHPLNSGQGNVAHSGTGSGLATEDRGSGTVTLSADLWSRMDAAGAPPPASSNGSPRMFAVGIDDPGHGWIEVRAQGVPGQVTASLTAASPEAHSALHAQLPSMAQYLAEREIAVRNLAVGSHSSGDAGAFAGHSGQGFSQGSGQASNPNSGQASRQGPGSGREATHGQDALGGTASGPSSTVLPLDGTGIGIGNGAADLHLISVRV